MADIRTSRIVAGYVDGGSAIDGKISVTSGTGDFEVNRIREGHFEIVMRPAFTTIYGGAASEVLATDKVEAKGGDTRDNAVIVSLTPSRVVLQVGDNAGSPKNREFSFIFYGSGSVS